MVQGSHSPGNPSLLPRNLTRLLNASDNDDEGTKGAVGLWDVRLKWALTRILGFQGQIWPSATT